MKHIADLPDTIAVFPLPGAILLPRSRLPLHIFEPRYLAMIEDCLKSDHRRGLPLQSLDQSDSQQSSSIDGMRLG